MTVWLEIAGAQRRVELPAGVSGVMECSVDSRTVTVDARILQPGMLSLLVEGRQYRCVLDGDVVTIDGQRVAFAVSDPRSLRGRRGTGADAAGPRAVKAPMPGRVVRILAEAGQEVAEHQGVIVIEAMKMQNELKSPKTGRVVRVAVAAGDAVGAGEVLVVVE